MGNDAIRPTPKKSGCLKWAVGCLICAVLLVAIAGVTLWYLFSRWEAGQSAWEHLPPEVSWAAEVHDVKGLLGGAVRDEGIYAILRSVNDELRPIMREFDIENEPDGLRSLVEGYSAFSPFYTTLLPNTAILGGVGAGSSEAFVIFQPPRWFSWFYGDTGGVVQTVEIDRGDEIYLATMDGWAILAMERDTMDLVLESWRKKAAPLGARMTSRQPYLLMAGTDQNLVRGRMAKRRGNSPEALPPEAPDDSAAGHFMLRDPFAEAPLAGQHVGEENADPNLRMALTSEADGWQFWLELVPSEHFADGLSLAESVDAKVGGERPAVELPDASDMELSLRLPDDLFENMLNNLQDDFSPVDEGAPAYRRLGWRWFRNAWMGRAGGDFAILASRPVARTDGAYPPMPVFSLGWTIADGVSGEEASRDFATALADWLDALQKPGEGPKQLELVGESLAYTITPEKNAGTIELPAVLVNAARPAWRFNEGMGWLGTDPSGLPAPAVQRRIRLGTVRAPEAGELNAGGSWHLSRDFLDGLNAFVTDRLDSLPDSYFADMSRDDVRKNLRRIHGVLTAFPKAAARMQIDLNTDSVYLKTYIPHGTKRDGGK